MKTFEFKPFIGLEPQTVKTFEALLRGRFIQYMKMYIEMVRLKDVDPEIAQFSFGVCQGMVLALYDVSSPMAWQYLKALRKLENHFNKNY